MRPSPPARRFRVLHRSPVALLAAVVGCSLFWDPPSVRIADVRVSDVGLTGATADIVLSVENPNGFSLTSKELHYLLEFDDPGIRAAGDGDPWLTVAEGRSERAVTVARQDTSRVTLNVPFRYEELGRAVMSFLREGRLRYRLRGDILFDAPVGDVRVPFEDTGQLGF